MYFIDWSTEQGQKIDISNSITVHPAIICDFLLMIISRTDTCACQICQYIFLSSKMKVIISEMDEHKVGNKNFKGFFKPKPSEAETTAERTVTQSEGNKVKGFFKTVANEETSGSALLGLLLYSLIMFFLPLVVYFLSKDLLESYDYRSPVSTIGPAILAIVTVNLVIVAYVIKAFREENKIKEKSS